MSTGGNRMIRLLAGALLALSLVAATAPPSIAAGPAAPANLTPSGVSVAGNPVLGWAPVRGASSYRVEVDTTSDFASPIYSVTTTNLRATPTVALPAGEVWWRVRAGNDSGDSPWALTSFIRSAVAGPTLLSPAGGAHLQAPGTPALLSWSPINGATSYTIEIDDADDFVPGGNYATYTTKTTSLVVPSPQVAIPYFWRVRATLGSGFFTDWSESRDYTVEGLTAAELVAPEDSALTVVDDVILDWAPVAGAKAYNLQVSTDQNFQTFTEQRSGIRGTRYSPPTTYDNDQYYWRIQPVDTNANVVPWESVPVWTFRRAWPDQPVLEFPADGSVIAEPGSFEWSPVHLASRYVLQLDTTSDFGSPYATCTTELTTFTPRVTSDCWPQALVTTYWRVIAYDDTQPVISDSISADVGSFSYQPTSVGLLSPADGEQVAVPTLAWTPVNGASKYKVTITAVDGGAGGGTFTTATTEYTPRTKLTVGKTYVWDVKVFTESQRTGPGIVIGGQPSFTVIDQATPTAGTPTPLSPNVNAHFQRSPTLTWEPVVGATAYKVYVTPVSNSGWPTTPVATFAYPAGQDSETANLATGQYKWMVEAYAGSSFLNSAGGGGGATYWIDALPSVSAHRVALTGIGTETPEVICTEALPNECEQLKQTPTLAWDQVPEAGYYKVYISHDKEMTNPLFAPIETEQNRLTLTDHLIDSQAGNAFHWLVVACKAGDACSSVTHATHAFSKLSNPVEPTAPIDGAAVANDVTFTWRDYLETNLDPAMIDWTGLASEVEAKKYRIQVSSDGSFTTKLTNAVVDQTTFTAYGETYPEGTLYWRVQAIDASDNGLTWSATRTFVKSSPAPTLVSPVGGTVTGQTEAFRWQPLEFAAGYDLQIFANGDLTGSSGNLVKSVTNLKQAAYALDVPLEPSSLPYTWRVRRVDASGLKGAWSALSVPGSSFFVSADVPTLTSPKAGALVPGTKALFSWQAVEGVTSYRFERRARGASALAESVTTASLAWAPTKAIPDGRWEWRVVTLNASGKAMAASDWRDFRVDMTAPTVLRMSPTGTVSRTTNFKVVFSEKVKNVTSATFKIYRKGLTLPLSASVKLSRDGTTAILNPVANLKSGQVYRLVLTSGITDLVKRKLRATGWQVTAQ